MRFGLGVRTATVILVIGLVGSGCNGDRKDDDSGSNVFAPSPVSNPVPQPPPTPTPVPVPVPRPVTCSIVAWACSPNGFGAIAHSPGGRSGWSHGFSTRSAAEARAIHECGVADCRVSIWFQSQCGALARSSDGSWSSGLGSSQSVAEANAMSSCRAPRQGPSLPQPTCAPNGTSAVNVPIRNTTGFTFVITFTGAITRSATIPAGTTQTLTLLPGAYRATGEVVGAANVTLEPSTWTVSSGCTYSLEIVAR